MRVRRLLALLSTTALLAAPAAHATPFAPSAVLDRAAARLATATPSLAVGHERLALATARRMLDTMAAAGPDRLRNAAALAREATNLEAAALDVAIQVAPPVRHATPSAAATAIVARYGITPTAAQRASIRDLDRLAEPVRGALTAVLDAYLGFDIATVTAYAHVDRARLEALSRRDPFAGPMAPIDLGVDLGPVFGSRLALLDAAATLRDALRGQRSTVAATVSVCPAIAIDLDGGDDTYPSVCALIVDREGNDTYTANPGGGCFIPAAAALVDLGGDDVYDAHFICGPGSGSLGAGFLVDDGGDDSYAGGNAANGGADLAGSGFLVDTGGNDSYVSRGTGGNGGGALGTGLLVDGGGDDAYSADPTTTVHNGSGAFGVGVLVDAGGDDTYAGGRGAENGAGALGLGLLVDRNGNDTYSGSTVVNGSGAFGAGLLVDGEGNDAYTGHGTASNGSSALGVGMLLDLSGVDAYTTDAAFGDGNGYGAFGPALLLDGGGTGDAYTDVNGTATDATVVPKGLGGAQVDLAT